VIVDSSALLAILLSEPERRAFAATIIADAAPRMSAASYVEVALKVDRAFGAVDPQLDATLADLGIILDPVTPGHARIARDAFNRFGRAPARLNFGDCLVYALARTSGAPLLFKGNDFIHTDIVPALPAGA
jgi:ribonuclease VapC